MSVSCLWWVGTVVCGIIIAKLLLWHSILSACSFVWLRTIECWQINIIVWYDASLVLSAIPQYGELSKSRGPLPYNDVENEGADG